MLYAMFIHTKLELCSVSSNSSRTSKWTSLSQPQVTSNVTMGKFDCRVWYVIIFLYVQFCFRLAAVSYHGRKVRTLAYPALRSVNKSRDTWNCIQNEPEYAICVIFTTCVYYIDLWLIFVCSDVVNIPQLQWSWRWPLWHYRSPQDVSAGHRRCHGDNLWKLRNDMIV